MSVAIIPIDAMIDLVDEHDVVVGTARRSEVRAGRLLHRCTAVLVLNEASDQLLVQQRSRHKDLWPLWWDLVSGGVVEAGEDLNEAAARELGEEIGITTVLAKLGSRRHTDADVDVFMHVWLGHHNGPFVFSDGEVEQTEWVNPDQLRHRLRTDHWCTDSRAVALPMLVAHDERWRAATPKENETVES